jgi:hypothetical protein
MLQCVSQIPTILNRFDSWSKPTHATLHPYWSPGCLGGRIGGFRMVGSAMNQGFRLVVRRELERTLVGAVLR